MTYRESAYITIPDMNIYETLAARKEFEFEQCSIKHLSDYCNNYDILKKWINEYKPNESIINIKNDICYIQGKKINENCLVIIDYLYKEI